MALAHTQLIDRYDRNRDIAALNLSDNGLEYENCKAERTASLVWPGGAKTFRMRLYIISLAETLPEAWDVCRDWRGFMGS
jgi:hypothetical protein